MYLFIDPLLLLVLFIVVAAAVVSLVVFVKIFTLAVRVSTNHC